MLERILSNKVFFIYLLGFSLLAVFLTVGYVYAQNSLNDRLKGRVLLQVEQKGEAWYVDPENGERRFLGRPNDAFNLMRDIGVGIINKDLEKIPVADANMEGPDTDGDGLSDAFEDAIGTDKNNTDTDGDGYNDKEEIIGGYNPKGKGKINIDNNFAKIHNGKVFIQVEGHGEAWYINPVDGKRYFLFRPKDAFNVMRKLGLGITDNDLDKIAKRKEVTYVAMGASVTVGASADPREVNGYAYLVRNALKRVRKVKFNNMAIGGTKIEFFLNNEFPEALKLNPDVVTVLVGGNDIITGTSINDFADDLDMLLKRLKENSIKVAVINSPNIANYPKFIDGSNEFVTIEKINEFNHISKEKADKYGFVYVDIFNSKLSTDMSLISDDGIHPNKEGHKFLAGIVIRKIKEIILNQGIHEECPQYSSPALDWCANGTIISGGVDENGCQSPPTCEEKT